MAAQDTIEVFTEDTIDLGSPGTSIPSTSPRTCQLVPPCKEGNHGVQIISIPVPDKKPIHRKIGKYYFTEEALKHDLAALKRGKVYTKQEFYRRARAWYKADIDRILHWHRVYKEQNPGHPDKLAQTAEPRPDPKLVEEATTEPEVPSRKEQSLVPEEENKVENAEPENNEEAFQDTKPKSRPKKAKVPTAPTRVQPPRAAKRKAFEPPPPSRPTKRKKKTEEVIEDTIEAAAPTPEPDLGVADKPMIHEVEITVEHKDGQPVSREEHKVPESEPQEPTGKLDKQPDPGEQNGLQTTEETNNLQQAEVYQEETKGDYQLNIDEWNMFLARYNSATTPVTPTADPVTLSAFTQKQLQGLDIASFVLRLECIVEAKINDLFDKRQGITIDAAAGGGLCLTGYYHHPYKCALDGNYVPPPRFEAAGGFVPGEDWKPEPEKEVDKERHENGGDSRPMKEEEKDEGQQALGWTEDVGSTTTGVVSSPKYRPPGSGKKSAERTLFRDSFNLSQAASPAGSQDGHHVSAPRLEAALHREAQRAATGRWDYNDDDDAISPKTIRKSPQLPTQLSQDVENNVSRTTSMRNSPAPEALMEISPTLGRWRPPTTGLPLENFDDAIVDFAGLRFAVDLCAGYLGDGRSARMFML